MNLRNWERKMKNNSLRFRKKKLNLIKYLIFNISMFESIRLNIDVELKECE